MTTERNIPVPDSLENETVSLDPDEAIRKRLEKLKEDGPHCYTSGLSTCAESVMAFEL